MTLSQKVTRMRFGFLVLLGAVLFASPQAKGQDFNYTVAINTSTWSELSSQTLCNSVNLSWADSYIIPIGFMFPFNGNFYDTVRIETNGYLVFDANREHAFTAYNSFRQKLDSIGNYSVLSYELGGTIGNHIMKIQYKNVGQQQSPHEFLSYQIWLYENGHIDVITGPHSYSSNPNDPYSVPDTNQFVRTGMLNMYMTGTVFGYFVGQTATGSGGQPANSAQPDPVYFNTIPESGTRFTFLPASN